MESSEPQPNTTWAKVEVMGRVTLYGKVMPSPYLDSGIRVQVLPGGDPENEKETYPRCLGENAIFGIVPVSEDTARKLSRRDYYDASPLDHAEQRQIVEGRITAKVAKDIVRAKGYKLTERAEDTDEEFEPDTDLPW